jgi:hypothetical protein
MRGFFIDLQINASIVVLAVAGIMPIFLMAVGVTTLVLVAVSLIVIVVIRHPCRDRHCRTGLDRRAFTHGLAYRSACGATDTGTDHGTGLTAHGLPDCRTRSATDRATHYRTGLALALGGDRSTYAAADRTAYHGTGLAADRLADSRTGCGTYTTANGSLNVAIGSQCMAGGKQQTQQQIRCSHRLILPE